MSVSKLESLPNEILTDILEKYINGIDILNAFAFQLNHRFDALIIRSQRLHFDFMRCHKDAFRFCMGLLPAYIDRIEELALSEENTPGQIYAFLSFFPSFSLFKSLRQLYFHVYDRAIQPDILRIALESLLEMSLHTLCITMEAREKMSSLDYIIAGLFRMKTLKKLSLTCNSSKMQWTTLNEVSSSIEYLTIVGIYCSLEDLQYIFRCAPGLKYLNISLHCVRNNNNDRSNLTSINIKTPITRLHTVIFRPNQNSPITPNMLEPYLKVMTSLYRLEIKGYNDVSNMNAWETLLKTSAPMLTYFTLESEVLFLDDETTNIFESIQTPFWIEKKNFNIFLKPVRGVQNNNPYVWKDPLDSWWIRPRRGLNDNLSPINNISSLVLSSKSSTFLINHYLDNVKYLEIRELNDDLLQLITTHVNCSRIKHLDLTNFRQNRNILFLFVPYIKDIVSLRISLNQLLGSQFICLKECNNLKFLDISKRPHLFNEENIYIIGNMFPKIEHLMIHTQILKDVPMLQTYLSHIRSVSFINIGTAKLSRSDQYGEQRADDNLRQNAQFLFYRKLFWITVWIDEAVLQDSFWNNITYA